MVEAASETCWDVAGLYMNLLKLLYVHIVGTVFSYM
jgi:hypothetical protein